MTPIGWTKTAVATANTNRDGSGAVVLVWTADEEQQYVDSVRCYPLGTNVTTEAVLIGSNGSGVAVAHNNFLLGNKQLAASTLGTAVDTDVVEFPIGVWFPKGFEIYALVHATQAAGRQFVAFSDPSYQQY